MEHLDETSLAKPRMATEINRMALHWQSVTEPSEEDSLPESIERPEAPEPPSSNLSLNDDPAARPSILRRLISNIFTRTRRPTPEDSPVGPALPVARWPSNFLDPGDCLAPFLGTPSYPTSAPTRLMTTPSPRQLRRPRPLANLWADATHTVRRWLNSQRPSDFPIDSSDDAASQISEISALELPGPLVPVPEHAGPISMNEIQVGSSSRAEILIATDADVSDRNDRVADEQPHDADCYS